MRLLNFRIEFILYFFRENIKHYYIKYFPKQKYQKKSYVQQYLKLNKHKIYIELYFKRLSFNMKCF